MGLRGWWVLLQVSSPGRPLRRHKSQVGEAVVTAKPPALAGISGVHSKGGGREMSGKRQLTPTGNRGVCSRD